MGKKTKTGKQRLDKYYYLAKEQGYRARSAFKLIQLTQKNDIFSGCRSLLDLCAAPGGWLQVAQKNMPIASTIVGVDLVPIQPIRGVTTIQADITTQRCYNLLKQHIPVGTCDVVLHDGAPNVGANWLFDAYGQNELVLHSTKLACEFLRSGGTFVTKVFRSTDYASLLWVFQQLFERATATKPSSSRNVSAEIFVICQGFKNPQKIDPKFFDPKFVFINTQQDATTTEAAATAKPGLSLLVKAMGVRKRGGYEEGDDYRVGSVCDFFNPPQNKSPAEFITSHHKLIFPEDDTQAQKIKHDPSTKPEIFEYCEDLKVIGKREFAILIKWRFRMMKKWAAEEAAKNGKKIPVVEEPDSEAEKAAWEKELVELSEKMSKKELNEKRKLREKLKRLKLQREMSLGAFDAEQHDPELFALSGKDILDEEDKILDSLGVLDKNDMSDDDESSHGTSSNDSDSSKDDENEELDPAARLAVDLELAAELEKERRGDQAAKRELRKKKETRRQQVFAEWSREIDAFSSKLKTENVELKSRKFDEKDSDSDDDDSVPDADEYHVDEDDGVDDEERNDEIDDTTVLKVSASNKKGAMRQSGYQKSQDDVLNKQRTSRWFDQDMFKDVGVTLEDLQREDQLQNDHQIIDSVDEHKETDGIREMNDADLPQMPLTEKQKRKDKRKRELEKKEAKESRKKLKTKSGLDDDKDGFEEVPLSFSVSTPTFGEDEEEGPDCRPRTPEEIAEVQAVGSLLVKKRSRMDLIDGAYNRYAFNDDDCVPDWFREDEEAHNRPELPVTKELMRQYRAKIKEISERPIRKVLEAAGRKKMRLKKKLERVRKQAEGIAESPEHSEFTKGKTIQKLIGKVKRGEKKEKSYQVSRKQGGSVQAGKPKSGQVKVVDRRLKADKRGQKAADRRNKKKK